LRWTPETEVPRPHRHRLIVFLSRRPGRRDASDFPRLKSAADRRADMDDVRAFFAANPDA
jgi:hypothetical protein